MPACNVRERPQGLRAGWVFTVRWAGVVPPTHRATCLYEAGLRGMSHACADKVPWVRAVTLWVVVLTVATCKGLGALCVCVYACRRARAHCCLHSAIRGARVTACTSVSRGERGGGVCATRGAARTHGVSNLATKGLVVGEGLTAWRCVRARGPALMPRQPWGKTKEGHWKWGV